MINFDLENARQQEAERRFQMLGDYVHANYDRRQLRTLASERKIPASYLAAWKHAYLRHNLEGLLPQGWEPLTQESQQLILERFTRLGRCATALVVSDDDIITLAGQQGWSFRTADRWVRRYRIGGLWALLPKLNLEKERPLQETPSALAACNRQEEEKIIEEINRKRNLLGEAILEKAREGLPISEKEIEERATTVGKSTSLFRKYIRDIRKHGNAGLAPRRRSDKGHYHNLSKRMEQIIRGLRLSKMERTLDEVHREACLRARALGEPEPSMWHVRTICAQIPQETLALADRQERKFRNIHRTTYRRRFDPNCIVYQTDATQIDTLVIDKREEGYHTKSKEVRPWVTICIESYTRLVMAAQFSYEEPDQHTVAAVIRDALLVTEDKPYGGIPDEIWVDRGKAMIARHVQQIAQDLGIELHPCFTPEQKGIIERYFRTLNTRLWATLSGYVNSNVAKRNPKAKAELTLPDLVSEFWKFINVYHQEIHSETKVAPYQAWMDTCLTSPADPRQLDILLQVVKTPTVYKEGIKYAGRVYWHDSLMEHVNTGDQVLIRAAPTYTKPDEIQVYSQGQWICSAFARDSETGRAITGRRVIEAQRRQREKSRKRIHEDRAALQAVDREIGREAASQTENGKNGEKKLQPLQQESQSSQDLLSLAPETSSLVAKNPASQSPRRRSTSIREDERIGTEIWDDLTTLQEKRSQRGRGFGESPEI